MPTNINFDKKLGFVNGTSIVLPSEPAADFSTKSLSFDGTDNYIEVADADNLSFGNGVTDSPFSISTWVNMTDATRFRIVSKYDSNFEYLFSTGSADTIVFNCYDNSTSARIGRLYSTALTSFQGSWIHLVATYSGNGSSSGLKIYLNGSRIDNTDNNSGSYTAMENTTAPLEIGKATTNYANGLIDEVAIFDVELSQSDITSIYNNGKPADLTSLNPLAWYRAGENSTFAYPQILMPEDTNKDKVSKYSLAFDGTSDYIDCGDPDEFSFGNGSTDSPFSISAWIKMNSTTGFRIFNKYAGSVNEYQFGTGGGNNLQFYIFDNTSNFKYRARLYSTTLNTGQWYHVAATYSGVGGSNAENGIKIYVDGVRVDDTTVSGGVYVAMGNKTTPVYIGKLNTSYANGLIDEVAVFPIELRLSDIQAIYNNGVPTDISSYSPLGYWKLGEEAKFTDNWLVPNSALSNFSKYSFNFDGIDDYIDCGNGASLQITGALTLSVWVKMSSTSGGSQDCIISKDNGTQRSYTLWGKTSFSSSPIAYIWNGGANYSVQAITNIEDDNWHHVMLVYVPSTSLSIYIDGTLENTNTTSIPSSINNASQNINIGRFGGGTFQLNGNIDEVAIWNSDQSSIASAIGSSPVDLSTYSPVSWWRFEGTGTTATDSGSGGNDGTLTNGVTRSSDVPT